MFHCGDLKLKNNILCHCQGKEESGKYRHAEFISASLASAFGQRFRNKFGMTINHNKLRYSKQSEGFSGDIMKKCAFTLAEVLITLGVIGVVAAITIPGLMTKYRHHVMETNLAKFVSIINQAVRMSIAENGNFTYEPPANRDTNVAYLKEWFDEYLLKYMKVDYEGEVIGNRYPEVVMIKPIFIVIFAHN